jgi:hypothetical protein
MTVVVLVANITAHERMTIRFIASRVFGFLVKRNKHVQNSEEPKPDS